MSRLLVATNLTVLALLSVAAVSDLVLTGNVTYGNTFFDDVTVSSERAMPGAGSPSYDQIVDGAYAYALDVGDGIRFAFQMPHRMKSNTTLDLHAHIGNVGDETGGNVQLRAECCALDIGEACSSTPDIDSGNIAVGTTLDSHIYADIGNITGVTGLSAIILCSVSRIAATENELGTKIWLFAVDAHFEIDQPGSQAELTK